MKLGYGPLNSISIQGSPISAINAQYDIGVVSHLRSQCPQRAIVIAPNHFGGNARQIIRPSGRAVLWGHDKWEWTHYSLPPISPLPNPRLEAVAAALVSRENDCLISQYC